MLFKEGLGNMGTEAEMMEREIGDIWLHLIDVANLLGVTLRAIQKACKQGKYKTERVKSCGQKGFTYQIALSSLPPEAQVVWVNQNPKKARTLPEYIRNRLSSQAQWEITRLMSPKESVGLEMFIKENLKKRLATKIKAIQKALSSPAGTKKSEWIRQVASEFGISHKTLYRDLKIYREKGLAGLVNPREKKGLVAWDKEAIEFMQGVYLKAVRECGQVSKRRAYQAVIAEAEKKGWRIGSESSAFAYLRSLNPLLAKYACAGRRALDNVFYIMREYKDLAPFEVNVGDQHRFDFWVRDAETGNIFRPECYLWLDLRTRLIYGLSIARHYDRYLMGHAIRMGMMRWGMFQSCYTDNGKPEISEYVNTIINDITAWGSQVKDIAELYKTDEGYVIEGPDGEPIESVSSPQMWHRRARAYNAKAKPIERFFRSFEVFLRDLGTPGLVRGLKGVAEEKALADKRLKHLIETNQLLTFEEFLINVFKAVEIYNQRRHAALRRSPIEELWRAVKKEGFVPRYLSEAEVDFVLLARTSRKVQRGRILLNHTWYQGEALSNNNLEAGLWHLPDKTEVEIRYDPFDPAKVIAVLPDESVRRLEPVPVSSMRNRKKTSELMAWKRQMIQAVTEHYRRLTRPVSGIVEYSKRTRQAKAAARQAKQISQIDFEQIKRDAERMVKESLEDKKVVPMVSKRPVFKDEWEYYRWCLDMELAGKRLTAKDRAFMAQYEAKMDEDERQYWNIHRRVYGQEKHRERKEVGRC